MTLLFSDIEGSTRLLQRLGPAYADVLAEQRRLFRQAVAAAGGVEVDTQGDAFFCAFAGAFAAVDAAVAIQRALRRQAWPEGVALRVRMGLHTGQPTVTGDGYVGIELHEGARICSAAHGGQVLVSEAARQACDGRAASWGFRALGRFRLKDVPEPALLHQVVAPDLPAEFPPPRTIDARPNNLPAETTEFVGRAAEVAAVEHAIRSSRLVTLVGPGGTGKTRLAIHVAKDLLGDFADGVFVVRLEALTDATDVPSAVAGVLGIPESGEGPLVERLSEALRPRQMLLVQDCFEHVIPAAELIVRLLHEAPGLRVLVTSQIVLHCDAERVFPLRPLAVPAAGVATLDALLANDAVDLFVRRARAVDPSFRADEANVRDIAAIVTRLEGMPLAIELAAARARMFPPAKLLMRLEDRFRVLDRGHEAGPLRHRTLMNLVQWSYGLLTSSEQALLQRLSVFRGGFTLEAAEQVAQGPPVDDVVVGAESLLDKSLLHRVAEASDIRLSISDTIREFAAGLLHDGDAVRRRHAMHFHAVVLAAEPVLTRAGQREIQARLAEDDHNLRAAFDELSRAEPPDDALSFARALWRYWQAMGRLDEGRRRVEALLARPPGDAAARAAGLLALGGLAYWQADHEAALDAYREALAILRHTGPSEAVAETLFALSATSTWSGRSDDGERFADEALAAFRALGHRDGVGRVLMAHGFARWVRGDLAAARPLWEQSLAIAREIGDHVEAATKEVALAAMSFQQGERVAPVRQAVAALEELVARHSLSHVVMALCRPGRTHGGPTVAGIDNNSRCCYVEQHESRTPDPRTPRTGGRLHRSDCLEVA